MRVGNLVRVVCLAVLCTTAGQVKAGMISASDRGYYERSTFLPSTEIEPGYHSSNNLNYLAGSSTSSGYYNVSRNFFVFDLSGLSTSEIITSASLRLKNSQGTPSGNYTVYDVSTSIPDLTADGSSGATFDDLGTGTSYGIRAMSSADDGTFVTINLNAAGLSALNVARGGFFATGGTFAVDGFAFNNSDNILSDTSLVYEVSSGPAVPEPTTMVMFGIGALGMGLVARRRKKHSNAQ